MTYNVLISELAEEDIKQAFAYYNDQESGLGQKFGNEIKSSIRSIRSNPHKTQVRYLTIRVFFLNKFPFGIHFTIKKIQ